MKLTIPENLSLHISFKLADWRKAPVGRIEVGSAVAANHSYDSHEQYTRSWAGPAIKCFVLLDNELSLTGIFL